MTTGEIQDRTFAALFIIGLIGLFIIWGFWLSGRHDARLECIKVGADWHGGSASCLHLKNKEGE